jgi:hypothetical protein
LSFSFSLFLLLSFIYFGCQHHKTLSAESHICVQAQNLMVLSWWSPLHEGSFLAHICVHFIQLVSMPPLRLLFSFLAMSGWCRVAQK